MAYKSLLIALLMVTAVTLLGATGYVLIEDWSFFDGLYMTVITIASVGYGETHELSHNGRIYTIFLILCGTGVMVYGFSALTAFIVEGDLTDVLKGMKMKKTIDRLSGHYLVCGDSSTGKYVIEEMRKTHRPFVVVEKDPAKIAELARQELLYIEGDATSEAVLREAGIERACGLIATLHSDADNLFVALTAKGLNPDLRVIAKAVDEESRGKLMRVGADGVVMPNAIGGMRMVSEMVRPGVVTFLDVMLRDKDRAIRVEEISIQAGSAVAGKTLGETGILAAEGASVVALVRPDQPYRFNPSAELRLETGDTLIIMGMAPVIAELDRQMNAAAFQPADSASDM
jgi:voltage-gated potassium channel